MLQLLQSVYDEIRAHGEETYPHECCGALLGKRIDGAWHVSRSLRAGNTRTDSAHNRYQISPLELMKMEREARSLGVDIAGFYHSHPDHPAQWSQTDFEEAHWLGCFYIITAVAKGAATITNAFHLQGSGEDDKRFVHEEIQLHTFFD